MNHNPSVSERWSQYRPTKTVWFWSMVGAAILTIVVGFSAGGWTTGGSARLMAERAAKDGRAKLASAICVNKFTTAPSAAANFAELKKKSSYQQDDYIKDGGWVTFAGVEESVQGAADLCAETLAAMESLKPVDQTADVGSKDS